MQKAFAPAAHPGGDEIVEIDNWHDFMVLAADWDELVRETNDQFFYRHHFFANWLQHFAPTAKLRILALRDETGRLAAILPLIEKRAPFYGLPVKQLVSPANVHSCRFDMIARSPSNAAAAFMSYLRTDLGWDVLRLVDTPQDGQATALKAAATGLGFPTGQWDSTQAPYIDLPHSHDALLATLDRKFRQNLRRRRKRLRELGEVSLERITTSARLRETLEEGLQLEASGWKGERGSAMLQSPETRGFYTDLAYEAADRGALSFYFLRLDGRAIAFRYGFEHQGRYLLLKSGYDESLGRYSPGQLLMEDMLQDMIARGLSELDLLGDGLSWKRDWTSHTRPHTWLYIFRRGLRGQILRDTKFRWAPAVKTRLDAWRR